MHNVMGMAASYVVNAGWETALIALAAWLAGWVLRRLGAQAEHAVWVAALFAAVIAPALPVLRRVPALFAGSEAAGGQSAMTLIAQSGAYSHGGVVSMPEMWLWWLVAVYVATALFFAIRLVLSLRGTSRMVRQADAAALDAEQEEIWDRCREAFALRGARILASGAAPGPVALEVRGPVLLLPADFAAGCRREDFLAAVAHECGHLKRRDFQKNVFYEALSLALSWHPLIWVIKSRIAQTREMICDAMATERQVEPNHYARSLLRLAAGVARSTATSTPYAIGIFDAGILEKRIMRIKMRKQRAGAVVRYGLMILAAAILISAAAGAVAMAVVVAPQAAPRDGAQPTPYGEVYHVGNGVSAPVPLNTVAANFPESARKDKKQSGGVVLLRLIVDAEGMPQGVHVVHSYRPDFDAEAVKAVKKYRFKPALRQGKPVAVWISVEVNFKRY